MPRLYAEVTTAEQFVGGLLQEGEYFCGEGGELVGGEGHGEDLFNCSYRFCGWFE